MNDELKKILFDLVEYYNTMGTENDPGIGAFADIAQRASIALEVQHRIDHLKGNTRTSADVDPFAITDTYASLKLEDEW